MVVRSRYNLAILKFKLRRNDKPVIWTYFIRRLKYPVEWADDRYTPGLMLFHRKRDPGKDRRILLLPVTLPRAYVFGISDFIANAPHLRAFSSHHHELYTLRLSGWRNNDTWNLSVEPNCVLNGEE